MPGLAQIEQRAPGDHLPAMVDERAQHVLQGHQARAAPFQSHQVDAEHALHGGELVEIVENDLRHLAAPQLDDDAHAVLVGFIAQFADAGQLLVLHQLGDLLLEPGLVDLIGQLGDHDALLVGFLIGLYGGPGPHVDAAAAGAVSLADAAGAVDDAGGGKVWAGDVFKQLLDAQGLVLQQRQAGGDHLHQVVRRDIRGHAHRDAAGAVDQQIGQAGGQHHRLLLRAVVVGGVIDGLLVYVLQELMGDPGHAHLGVAHGGRGVAIDRAEIALAIHQHVAQGEVLGHAHDGVVHGGIPVGVVFADDIAHHPGGLLVGLVVVIAHLVHGEQDAPVDGLETVSHIWQGPAHDDAHGVIHVGLAHFVLDVDRRDDAGDLFGHDFLVFLLNQKDKKRGKRRGKTACFRSRIHGADFTTGRRRGKQKKLAKWGFFARNSAVVGGGPIRGPMVVVKHGVATAKIGFGPAVLAPSDGAAPAPLPPPRPASPPGSSYAFCIAASNGPASLPMRARFCYNSLSQVAKQAEPKNSAQ